MPTYQYACTACSHQLEAVQSFSDDPLTECPECQGRLRKLFGSVGVVFKGSGFYRTDSRAAENGKRSGNGSESKDAASKSDGAAKSGDGSSSAGSSNGSSSGGSSSSGASSSGSKDGSASGGSGGKDKAAASTSS